MIPIPNTLIDDKRVLTLVEREGDVALFSYTMRNSFRGWELVILRKYADKTFTFGDKVTFSPAHEAIPPASMWGNEGWSIDAIRGLDYAYERFVELALKTGPSPIMGEATGKARGRARSEFVLDLSPFAGIEFEFANVAERYNGTPQPMLRNRLREAMLDDQIEVVREIGGGRGKPRKVYRLVSQ